jgi:acyl-homoserine lactone synthase
MVDFPKFDGGIMIEILTGVRPGEHPWLEQAFKLRHQVFVEERHWEELRRPDAREIDQFDGPGAVHHLAMHHDSVVGYQRFVSTLGPHLLGDVHPHLCARPYPKGPHVWEWTRYCVAPSARGKQTAGDAASDLMAAALEWALPLGITEFVLEFNPIWINRFLDLGYAVRPLGLPQMMGGEPVVAVHMKATAATLKTTRASRRISGYVLSASARAGLTPSRRSIGALS